MVSRQAHQGQTLKMIKQEKRQPKTWFLILLLVLVAALAAVGYFMIKTLAGQHNAGNIELSAEETNEEEVDDVIPKETRPPKITFQETINEWVKGISGDKSVLIYDLDRGELAGAYDETKNYNMASLYKLFVVYEGYRRLENGDWDKDALAGTTGQTILECLDLAIRESDSACAETLRALIGYEKLAEILVQDFGIVDSDMMHLVSTPKDIAKMLQIYYQHKDIRQEELIAKMKDSFLNQPATEYDWRQGLPSGFKKAKAYNKVGWDYNLDGDYWNVYHDAAIVEFPEVERHFVVVVMTSRVPYQQITRLGTMIEEAFYK